MKKVCLSVIVVLFTAVTVHATLFREKFATDPALDGWQVFGDTNLFQWDSTNHLLDVTWDSTQVNSYFHYPLPQTYTINDGFYVQFDLQVSDAVNYNEGLELAIGLLHWSDATNAGFSRANFTSPNICEFNYFPTFYDSYFNQYYSNSVEATVIDESGDNLYFASSNLTLNAGVTYQIYFIHAPGAGGINCAVSTNGQLITWLPWNFGGITNFLVDTLSVSSYQDDGFGDTLLAHGTVGNLAFASPLPIGPIHPPAAGKAQFVSDTNWLYTLEQSPDFQTWAAAAPTVKGNGTNLLLQATNVPVNNMFYRVEADLP